LLTGPGQRYRTRLSSKQRLTTIGFQQLDLMAYRGWRHPELGRGRLKVPAARRYFKCTQFCQWRKLPHPSSLDEFYSSALKIFDVASTVRIRRQLPYFGL
jgi:hypothetical protein